MSLLQSRAFDDCNHPVGGVAREHFNQAGRPGYRDLCLPVLAETKGGPSLFGTGETASRSNFSDLLLVAGLNFDNRANSAAVARCADGSNGQVMVAISVVAQQQEIVARDDNESGGAHT